MTDKKEQKPVRKPHKRGDPRMPSDEDIDRRVDRAVKKVFNIKPHPGLATTLPPDIKRDEIKQIIGEALYWYGYTLPKSDEEAAERAIEFFTRILETGEIPTWENFCLAMGTTRDVVLRWEQGEIGAERASIVKKARETMASLDAKLASQKKISEIVYIFRSKNYYGLKDKTETVISVGQQVDDMSVDDLRQRYLEGPKDGIDAEGKVE